MMKYVKTILCGLALLAMMAATSFAEEHERGGGHERGGFERGHERMGMEREWRGGERGEWHGEIGRFHEHDLDMWRGGVWRHEWHDGRLGWWWFAGGIWYFYPTPVYPYPDPYQPPVTTPPVVQPQYWYYCDKPAGYYPYVAQCEMPWRQVPAQPVPQTAPPR